MRVAKKVYDEFVEDHFPNMFAVRSGHECQVWAAGNEECLLIFFDSATQQATVFEYDTPDERQKDINLVLRLRGDNGDTGAGVPAVLGPAPPSRSASYAEPLPHQEPSED